MTTRETGWFLFCVFGDRIVWAKYLAFQRPEYGAGWKVITWEERLETGAAGHGESSSVALGLNFIKVQCGLVHHMDARGGRR